MKITKHIVVLLYFAFVSFQAGAQQAKPSYKDANMPVSFRVNDLLKRMTVAEKVGQLSTLMGWEMYTRNGEEVSASLKLKVAIADAHIGGLWAMLRADPWTQKTIKNGLNPVLSAKAVNAVQKYAIENSRLGIPLLLAEECPHGHMAIGTTVFPTSIGQASTWNPKLIKQMAAAIARETRAQGATIGYGPVLDLAREPRWSRVEETYGEDPVLIARMGEAVVSGFQGAKLNAKTSVISTLKHFAAYGAPEGGLNSGPISVGDRELQQSYFLPFKAAVKAGALSVMSAYNAVDGIPNSSNRYLLTDLLKKSWGLKGFTVSDLYAISGLV
ncbi:MAG: beta-glucosidase, partial [Chitinophagaceae bacterium]